MLNYHSLKQQSTGCDKAKTMVNQLCSLMSDLVESSIEVYNLQKEKVTGLQDDFGDIPAFWELIEQEEEILAQMFGKVYSIDSHCRQNNRQLCPTCTEVQEKKTQFELNEM